MNRKKTAVAVCLLALIADAIVFRQTLKMIDQMWAAGAAAAFAMEFAAAIFFVATVIAAAVKDLKNAGSAARLKGVREERRPLRRLFSEVWS
ncbi:MAG: hypothetical protein QUS14_15380 [Pyrinomonadaceae bacterium]|nr:hypothetical protein [Pyrinomonadaceae bacterium]